MFKGIVRPLLDRNGIRPFTKTKAHKTVYEIINEIFKIFECAFKVTNILLFGSIQ